MKASSEPDEKYLERKTRRAQGRFLLQRVLTREEKRPQTKLGE